MGRDIECLKMERVNTLKWAQALEISKSISAFQGAVKTYVAQVACTLDPYTLSLKTPFTPTPQA